MSVHLRQLKNFVALAEELNFRAAADRVHIAQSALTRQLQQLEKTINVTLLDRSRRPIKLTPAGEIFLEYAREILSHFDRGLIETRRGALSEANGLRLAFVASVPHVIISSILLKLRERYESIDFDLQELTTDRQLEELSRHKIDIGILRPRPHVKSIQYQPILVEPFIVVVPENHPMGGKKNVSLAAFADDLFIMHSGMTDIRNTTLFSLSMDLLRQAGIEPRITNLSSNHAGTALSLVKAGFGISLVPRSTMLFPMEGIAYATLKGSQAKLEIGLAWRHDDANPIRQAFVEAATEVFSQLT